MALFGDPLEEVGGLRPSFKERTVSRRARLNDSEDLSRENRASVMRMARAREEREEYGLDNAREKARVEKKRRKKAISQAQEWESYAGTLQTDLNNLRTASREGSLLLQRERQLRARETALRAFSKKGGVARSWV